MSAETDLYREMVVEHKRAPRNFGELPGYTHQARGRNPSCGDEINVQLRVADDHIQDIRFNGQGCAICIASTSMMTEAVRGGRVDDALALQQHFRGVMTGEEEADEDELGKLITLKGVQRYPSRIKCALLGWHALAHALNDSPASNSSGSEPQTEARPS